MEKPADLLSPGTHVIAYSETLKRFEYGVVSAELPLAERRYRRLREFIINFQGREVFADENVQLAKNRRLQIKPATPEQIEFAANVAKEIAAN